MTKNLLISASILLSFAAGRAAESTDLSTMTIEDLLSVEVKSVSRKEQKLAQTPAAVFVITREDIRRSGATSWPELLRMAPGLQVARISSSQWAITARGFNGRFANKILVLIDGRSVYTSLYSGVFWDQCDVMLENIERIEVIRGSGATMWGTNAVNGVINVITRSAQATQGALVSAGAGQNDRATAALRFGGRRGERLAYRMNAHSTIGGAMQRDDGSKADDAWRRIRAGGRVEWQPNNRDSLTVHGDMYRGRVNEETNLLPLDFNPTAQHGGFSGGYAQARWERTFAKSEMAVQGYYSLESRRDEMSGSGVLHTVDFDLQHRIHAGSRNDVVWGAGYRYYRSYMTSRGWILGTSAFSDNLASVFVQDDFTLIPDKLVLTGGWKLESNQHTGMESQPGARVMWMPTSSQSVWGAVSRAVRLPSMQDLDLNISAEMLPQNGLPTLMLMRGNPSFQPETLIALEAGYRRQIGSRITVDVALFQNWYSRLQALASLTPYVDLAASGPRLIMPFTFSNALHGNSDGIEATFTWTPVRWWRLNGSHTWMDAHLEYGSGVGTPVGIDSGLGTPRNSFTARSSWDIGRKWMVDAAVYSTSSINDLQVPAHVRPDVRVAYRIGESAEISAGITDALTSRHTEFRPLFDGLVPTQIRRSFYFKLVRSF